MTNNDVSLAVIVALFFIFIIWTSIRGRRWEKYREEVANRGKLYANEIGKEQDRYDQTMIVLREQLQASKDILNEIKALREDLKNK
ncbi:MAG TPA: hypothetical protein VGO67_21010 [Verrucomicrobiae bacterium]|jgi:hypothetical protein